MLQTAQSPQFAPAVVMTPRPLTDESNQVILAFAARVRRLFGATSR